MSLDCDFPDCHLSPLLEGLCSSHLCGSCSLSMPKIEPIQPVQIDPNRASVISFISMLRLHVTESVPVEEL